MAVWQATFDFGTTAGFPTDFRARLGRIAPPLTSWSDDLEMWGTEEGDRVDVWTEGGRAARFVEDPSRYFHRLRAGGLDDA